MARGKVVRTFGKRDEAEDYARRQNAIIRRNKYKVERRGNKYAVLKAPPYQIW